MKARSIGALTDEELEKHLRRHVEGITAILREQKRRFQERNRCKMTPESATPREAAPPARQ